MRIEWAAALFLIGCGGAGTTAGTGMGGSGDSGKPPAPPMLRSVESNAEGISDAAKVGDWTKAMGILMEAQNTWSSLKPGLMKAGAGAVVIGAIDASFTQVATDITSKSQRAAETDANTISLAVPDLFDLYEYSVPSDALRGDGVFRQLQIEAEYSDFPMATTDLTPVMNVWARLRPLVVVRAPMRSDIPGSSTVLVDLDGAIQRSQDNLTAHDATKLQASAQDGLDFIDVVETIFK